MIAFIVCYVLLQSFDIKLCKSLFF